MPLHTLCRSGPVASGCSRRAAGDAVSRAYIAGPDCRDRAELGTEGAVSAPGARTRRVSGMFREAPIASELRNPYLGLFLSRHLVDDLPQLGEIRSGLSCRNYVLDATVALIVGEGDEAFLAQGAQPAVHRGG